MSLSPTIAPAILETVIDHVAPHFLNSTAGNLPAARDAAGCMLNVYHVETEEELRLAAQIVSFGFHALEALSEAAAPNLSLNATLRLRGSAISLSREAHKCQRKLDQLQRVGLSASPKLEAPVQKAATLPPDSVPSQPPEPPQEVPVANTRKGGVQNWKMSRQQRRAAEQITANLQRNKAEQSRREASATPPSPQSTNLLGAT